MFPADKFIADTLARREAKGALRKLYVTDKAIDFCSNDYLGFARSHELTEMVNKRTHELHTNNGSGGSRLLAGNTAFAEQLENTLVEKHQSQAALVFNSGYDANVGLFSSLPSKGDTIIYDELVHASIHDGIRLSRADSFMFRHNDMQHLHERLEKATGNIYVVIESVYSMDGDVAPLQEIVKLGDAYNAQCIVDEAHGTGVFGMGLVQKLNLQEKVYARIHTYGKAMGCHGAVVVGSNALKQYLVNYARSFIYTTALPLHSLVSIECSYKLLEQRNETVNKLSDIIAYFRSKVNKTDNWIDSTSAIQSLVVPGNENVRRVAVAIQAHDMDVRPIMSPTVAEGKERIRVCLHAYNTQGEIDTLLSVINKEFK